MLLNIVYFFLYPLHGYSNNARTRLQLNSHTPPPHPRAPAPPQVYRHLVTLEALHLLPEMSAFASVEAISGTALELC